MRRSLPFLLCAFLPTVALAGPSRALRVTSYKDFAEGQEQGVQLSSDGSVQPGMSSQRLALPSLGEDSVRALVAAGGVIYAGTGGEGPGILTLGGGDKAPKSLLKLPAQTWVTALCALPGGAVLAATAQDGRVFIVEGGKARVLATVEGDHVWALAHDKKRNVVYAVSGPGRLFSITLAGKVEKVFDSGTKQLLSLDIADDGAVYVGSADEAVLYRVEPGRPARAVHDFAGNELRAIAHHGGSIYIAVNDMSRGQTGGVRITQAPTGTAPGAGPRPGSSGSGLGDRAGKGALFRIDDSGRVEQLHALSDGFFNGLTVDGQGNVYAAASTPGGRGRLFVVHPDRTVATAAELKESDALAVLLHDGGVVLGTGNSGALYRLSGSPPKDASYQSKVFDGQSVSRWGSVRFLGTGALRLETRSGNLAKPDATWSAWEPLQKPTPAPGTGELSGRVASPPGRYLQVRTFVGERAALQDLTVTYQPLNQRPRLTEVVVGEDPLGRTAKGPRPSGSTTTRGRQPVVKLRFKVENPDEDDLNYRVYLRPVVAGQKDAAAWLRISGPDALQKAELEWNTESVPDGLYEIKVVVSDERANPPETALEHALVTPPFLVDNRRPELLGVTFAPSKAPDGSVTSAGTITGRAADATSPLAELSFAIDGGDFLPVGPRDGVLDDLAEDFALRLPPLSPGAHTIVLRASDAADNLGTTQLLINVPRP